MTKSKNERELLIRCAAPDHFWAFCLYYDFDFFDKRRFLKDVALDFQFVIDEYREGRARTVGVSMPPRAGKSYITSLFCAFWLAQFPELSVMRNSCTATLYDKFSYDVRGTVKSEKFRQIFPNVQMSSDKQNIDGWNLETAKQVSYFGGGVGGTIIGFGANLAIYDDLYKDLADARSEGTIERVSMWKQSAHNSRMEKHCPEIGIGTRWSTQDVIGRAIDEGKFDRYRKIPALIDDRSFCEDVKTTQEYLKIKKETDEEIWDAEYMQEPLELKGLLFPKSGLKYFSPDDLKDYLPSFRFSAVDPADTGGDSLSAPFCDVYGTGVFVTDVIYSTDGTDVTIPDLVEGIVQRKLNAVEIEGNSAWKLFGKNVRDKVQERHPDCDIRIFINSGNKHTRILAQSAIIRNHFYFLKEEFWTPDYRKFMKVLNAYMREGGSKKDDAPDSLAIAAVYFTRSLNLW